MRNIDEGDAVATSKMSTEGAAQEISTVTTCESPTKKKTTHDSWTTEIAMDEKVGEKETGKPQAGRLHASPDQGDQRLHEVQSMRPEGRAYHFLGPPTLWPKQPTQASQGVEEGRAEQSPLKRKSKLMRLRRSKSTRARGVRMIKAWELDGEEAAEDKSYPCENARIEFSAENVHHISRPSVFHAPLL